MIPAQVKAAIFARLISLGLIYLYGGRRQARDQAAPRKSMPCMVSAKKGLAFVPER
jgi:hypothetical protein